MKTMTIRPFAQLHRAIFGHNPVSGTKPDHMAEAVFDRLINAPHLVHTVDANKVKEAINYAQEPRNDFSGTQAARIAEKADEVKRLLSSPQVASVSNGQ